MFVGLQLDLPWLFIRFIHAVGGITFYRDYEAAFLPRHYRPHLAARRADGSHANKTSAVG